MPKLVVLYWEPGSGGDFIQQLLLEQPAQYQGIVEQFVLTDHGRVYPELKKFFIDNFENQDDQWYLRTWTAGDCAVLSKFISTLDCDYFVVPTHHHSQLEFLQSQFHNSVSIGVQYPKNMFPLVLKNWCKKFASNRKVVQKRYNQPLHQALKSRNMFGEFMLSDQLKNNNVVKYSVTHTFDITVSLEDLYNNNIAVLHKLFQNNTHVVRMYDDWLSKQSMLHRCRYHIPTLLQDALGYNSRAVTAGEPNLSLDSYDNILIKHHCTAQLSLKTIPNFKTLQQAADFFEEHTHLITTSP
jgi:hypothetical protein